MSIAGTNPVSEREGNRRTFFLPKYWTVRDIMYPQETLSQCLLAVHDEEGEGGGDADGEHDKMRWELLTFLDELEQPVIINRSPEGDVIFEIDLDGVPLGHRHELGEAPILAEILEIAWDVA